MSVQYTFVDKLRQFFGFGPTAATAAALHAEVLAKRAATEAAVDKARAAKLAPAKKAVKKPVAFKEGAVDGDGDGLVQDGTPHERPAAKKKPAAKKPDPKDKKTK
jgi:hypothetical protein